MATSIEEIDSLLDRAQPVSESTPTATLRLWRSELVRASVFVSYALGVLSLDDEILNRSLTSPDPDVLKSLVDDLAGMLTTGWVGGGWSLSPDASASVGAAAELATDQSTSLLDLHSAVIISDLGDPSVVRDLLARVDEQRHLLAERREQLESRIRRIQNIVRLHYTTGDASIDDWLA